MAALASDWLIHFRVLWNRWTKLNETWQEARSQCPLPSLCFFGPIEKQDGRPGQFFKQVAHCTHVHDMWPFGPLVIFLMLISYDKTISNKSIFLCCLWSIAAQTDHFVRHLFVCLSNSGTFLVGTHHYVLQSTHAFLGMLAFGDQDSLKSELWPTFWKCHF